MTIRRRDIGRPAAEASRILVALGSNLATSADGGPRRVLDAALKVMPAFGIRICARGLFYRTPSLSQYAQADYVNSVVGIETVLPPQLLLTMLHRIEALFGRVRRDRWGPRTLDLDLLDYQGLVVPAAGRRGIDAVGTLPLALPHPGLVERGFVLMPLGDVVPGWRHPVTGESVEALIGRLPVEALRGIERLPG